MLRPIRHWVPFFHKVALPDQFPHLNHIIQHELLHLQIKSHSWTQSSNTHIKLNLTDTLNKTDETNPCLTVCTSVLCCPALLYSTLLWCLNVCLALTGHSISNLFLKKQQEISKMVEMAVLKAFPLLFLLLQSLLSMALTSKHLSLANIISWLSLPILLWTACLGNSRYKCNSFKEMWRNQSM